MVEAGQIAASDPEEPTRRPPITMAAKAFSGHGPFTNTVAANSVFRRIFAMSPADPLRFFISMLPLLSFASCRDEQNAASSSGDSPPAVMAQAANQPVPRNVDADAGTSEEKMAKLDLSGHEAVVVTLMNLQKEFVRDLGAMVEEGRTTEFVESLPRRKEKLRELLAIAEALPKPQSEERSFYRNAQESFADQNIALMDRLTLKVGALPDENEIREVFARLSEDEEMELLRGKFHNLYQ
jgi:hypothetical protein